MYMGVLHTLLCMLLSSSSIIISFIIIQCTKEGVYIPFPSRALKLSNLELNSYLPALNLLNADYLPKDVSYPLKVHYNIQVRRLLNDSFKIAQHLKAFSKLVLLFQLSSAFALARLMWEMLLHHFSTLLAHQPKSQLHNTL
jgi:hypothetical protein